MKHFKSIQRGIFKRNKDVANIVFGRDLEWNYFIT